MKTRRRAQTRVPQALVWALAMILSPVLFSAQSDATRTPPASEVSAREIEASLNALNHDRTSGTDGERKGAQYLSRKLTEYGIAHTTHEVHAPGATP
ncbi:MAG: hypothetical protein HYS05_05330 [Acidobacteria bacterium]|nr:hypothetical protein [Acidobacteriota bacterium]